MKLLILLVAFLLPLEIFGQMISGSVNDLNGMPLVGASVIVENTGIGTVTDADGIFRVEADLGMTLIFSYVGFQKRKVVVGKNPNISIILEEGILLDEAIVTALGISREKKSIGYAAQVLQEDDLSLTRESNIGSTLEGRIAGVQVISSAGTGIGGSVLVRIRGSNGLQGGSPLYIVDGTPLADDNFGAWFSGADYGNLARDINPDDISSITVLKGPSATAIYGTRAANGVILINTKKAKAKDQVGVSFTSTFAIEKIYILPEFQNEYAGGATGSLVDYTDPVDKQTYKGLQYSAPLSWGPKIDGTLYRPWWSWYPGEDYGKQIPLTAQPNNVRDFYETGQKITNNLAISTSNDVSSFRLSYTNLQHQGVSPNSQLEEHNLGIKTSFNLTERATLSTNINFIRNSARSRPEIGWSLNNASRSFNEFFQRQLDINQLRDYKYPDGTQRVWNLKSPTVLLPQLYDNPFFFVFENGRSDMRNRYFGNIVFQYRFNDQIKMEAAGRRDFYFQRLEYKQASGGVITSSYAEAAIEGKEDNYDLQISFQDRIKDFTIDAQVGGALRLNEFSTNDAITQGGLSNPDLFNLNASRDRPTIFDFNFLKQVRSVFGSVNLGYKNMLYLGSTLRNDWSSALPVNDNSYLYSSLNGSLVLSEWCKIPWISYAKLRAAIAQVGSDTDPYQTLEFYNSATPYSSDYPSFNVPDELYNNHLKPTLSTSSEFGLEMSFLQKKVGFDLTWYQENNKNQIIPIRVSGSSGYTRALINAGNIRDEGMEFSLQLMPLKTSKIIWNLSLNIAKNRSRVLELADGLDNYILAEAEFWSLVAPVGGDWGTWVGTKLKRIHGKPVIDEMGRYQIEKNQQLGKILPDYTGGMTNTLRFRNFELAALFTFQSGGDILSFTNRWNQFSGVGIATVGLNDRGVSIRDPVDEGGGVKVSGVLPSGEAHSVYVQARAYFNNIVDIDEFWIQDASFIKLRELRIGYNIKDLSSFLHNLHLSLYAQNLWLIHSNIEGLDPSELSVGRNPYGGFDLASLPSVRSFGIGISAEF